MVKVKRNQRKRFRCGLEQLLIGFVILSAVAIYFNVRIANQHSAKSSRRNELPVEPHSVLRQGSDRAQPVDQQKTEPPPKVETTAAAVATTNHPAKPQPSSPNDEGKKMHVVFSTSCSVKQDWQSYLFYFHAMIHNQQGEVTRIVSGCNPEEEAELRKVYNEKISIMSDKFHIHFTPEFGKQIEGVSFQSTKYWNKPFGVKHWLENKFGYRYEGDISTEHDEDIVVLVDPDMLMQRPFENNFADFPNIIWQKYWQQNPNQIYHKVAPGKPMAQDYSFGSQWLNHVYHNLTYVLNTKESNVYNVSSDQARVFYAAGPPYMLTARDMYRVTYHWSDFLPRIFQVHPKFMAEMYGYCMASAHLGLKHQLARGFMISNVQMSGGEGWDFLNDEPTNACRVQKFSKSVPHVIHFCQRYSIGEFFLSKYKLPTNFLSCGHPRLELPPPDIAENTKYSHFGDGSIHNYTAGKMIQLYRNAFMVCSLMPALNAAAKFYKDHHCPVGTANYDEIWNTFKEETHVDSHVD